MVAAIGAALVAVLLIDWNAIRFEGSPAGTIDAELRGNPVQIETRVAGYVTRIGTDDDQPVRRGQMLYEIEQDTYRAQVEQTQAALHQAQAEVAELDARVHAQQATIATQAARAQATQASSTDAHQEFARQNALRGTAGEVLAIGSAPPQTTATPATRCWHGRTRWALPKPSSPYCRSSRRRRRRNSPPSRRS